MAQKAPLTLPLRHIARFGWPLPPLAGAQDPPPTPPAADLAPTPPPAAAGFVPPADPPPADPAAEPQVFSREYVESLRREAAGYRTRAKTADELQHKLDEFENAGKSELERERLARESAEKALAQTQSDLLRERVARQKNLPTELAEVLQGTTEEEMLAHAERLAAFVTPAAPTPPKPTDGLPVMPRGTQQPGPDPMTPEQSNALLKSNPKAWNEMFEAGDIPPSALLPAR